MGEMGEIGFTVFFCECAFKGVKRPFLQCKTGILGLPKGPCGKTGRDELQTSTQKRNVWPAAFCEKEVLLQETSR